LEEEYNRNQDIDSAREALKYYLQVNCQETGNQKMTNIKRFIRQLKWTLQHIPFGIMLDVYHAV
jgi:hypothetical protein